MKSWQHKAVELPLKSSTFSGPKPDPAGLAAALDQHGRDGWELVEVVPLAVNGWTSHLIAFFKREAQ